MKEIIFALVIMLTSSAFAIGYVRFSVTKDFALLAGGLDDGSATNRSTNSSFEGRSMTGGL